MAKKSTSKVRASRIAPGPRNSRVAFHKDAQLLLRPQAAAFKLANDVIKRIVTAKDQDQVTAADKVLFLLSCSLSAKTLAGYSTLDERHIKEVSDVTARIKQYISDPSQKRPLNFLMLASPGSGKSHFIKCVADALKGDAVVALTYDLTALEKNDDLIPSLEAARNQKVADKIPLLFLDEFDTRDANFPMLLPLLWSGEINLGRHDLKLGKIIIVLAGSDSRLPEAMAKAKSMERNLSPGIGPPKIVDLLSRINGGTITIPPFYDRIQKIDRRADKICAAVHLLGRRFGSELRYIPIGLLRFIYDTEFRYGVRSISHLVDLMPFSQGSGKKLEYRSIGPFLSEAALSDSSFAYHLIEQNKDPNVIVESWRSAHALDVWLPVFNESDDMPTWISTAEGVRKDLIELIYQDIEKEQ